MKKTTIYSYLAALLFSFSSLSQALEIGEKLPKAFPIEDITKTFELAKVQINHGLNGKIQSLEARQCPSCELVVFTVVKDSRFYALGKPVNAEEIRAFNGQRANIVFDPQSKNLVRASFPKMEERK